jgi:hypothetical protein
MTAGTFSGRIDELRHRTGSDQGWLRGSVTVDQIYAHFQHERLDLHHPRGGHARYLAGPLESHAHEYLGAIADSYLDDGGRDAMIRAMEDLSDQVESEAPVEFWDLRRSGHPVVQLGTRTVYDRLPHQHRLTDAELKAKSRLRYLQLPDRLKGWIWWHVQHHTSPPPRRGAR